MIAPLAKFIDWSVLQIGYAMLPQSVWREAANERGERCTRGAATPTAPDFAVSIPPATTG